jgi:hypothetical protein
MTYSEFLASATPIDELTDEEVSDSIKSSYLYQNIAIAQKCDEYNPVKGGFKIKNAKAACFKLLSKLLNVTSWNPGIARIYKIRHKGICVAACDAEKQRVAFIEILYYYNDCLGISVSGIAEFISFNEYTLKVHNETLVILASMLDCEVVATDGFLIALRERGSQTAFKLPNPMRIGDKRVMELKRWSSPADFLDFWSRRLNPWWDRMMAEISASLIECFRVECDGSRLTASNSRFGIELLFDCRKTIIALEWKPRRRFDDVFHAWRISREAGPFQESAQANPVSRAN